MSTLLRTAAMALTLALLVPGLARADGERGSRRGGGQRPGRAPPSRSYSRNQESARSFSRPQAPQRVAPRPRPQAPQRVAPRPRPQAPQRVAPRPQTQAPRPAWSGASRRFGADAQAPARPRPVVRPDRPGAPAPRRVAPSGPSRPATEPARSPSNREALERLRQRTRSPDRGVTAPSRAPSSGGARWQDRPGFGGGRHPGIRPGAGAGSGTAPSTGGDTHRGQRGPRTGGFGGGAATGGTRPGGARAGGVRTDPSPAGGPSTGGRRGGVRTDPSPAAGPSTGGRRGGVRQGPASGAGAVAGAGRQDFHGRARSGAVRRTGGGVAATHGPRAGVRYSRRHYDRHGHVHHYWGYAHRWSYGGWCVSYWDPFYYSYYSRYWFAGLPAFGFGVVYYEPYYDPYFTVVVESPVYVVQEPAPAVQVAPEPAPAEEAPPGADAFAAGVEAFLAGDFEVALAHFTLATEADPENGEAWLALTHAAFVLGRYDAAARGVAEAAALGAFPRGYRFDPRPMYKVEGTFDVAWTRLMNYRRKYPHAADAHLVAAYLHVSFGQQAEANEAIVQVLTYRPEDETAPLLALALLPPLPPEATDAGD